MSSQRTKSSSNRDSSSYRSRSTSSVDRGAHRRNKRTDESDKSSLNSEQSELHGNRAGRRKKRLKGVTSNLSVISDAVGKGLKKLKQTTANALGVGENVDYKKLKRIQRERAYSLSGATKEDEDTEQLVESLVSKAHLGHDPRLDRHLTAKDVRRVNQAFHNDLKQFHARRKDQHEPPTAAAKSPQRSYINIDEVIEDGADVDEEVLDALLTKPSESDVPRRKNEVFRRYSDVRKGAERTGGQNMEDFQRQFTSNTASLPKTELPITNVSSRRSRSTITIFENFCNVQAVTTAGYCADRFISKPQSDKRQGPPFSVWDGGELISMEAEVLQINKEYDRVMEGASGAGMTLRNMDIHKKALINPGFKGVQPAKAEKTPSQQNVRKKPLPPKGNAHNFLYGRLGYNNYVQFRSHEQSIEMAKTKAAVNNAKGELYRQRMEIEDALKTAKEHYSDPHDSKSKAAKRLKKIKAIFGERATSESAEHLDTKDKEKAIIRTKLSNIKTYTPWFICAITVLQTFSITALVMVGGITQIGLSPIRQLSLQETWGGDKKVEDYKLPNIWMGPKELVIIKLGGLFAPCLREDIQVTARLLQQVEMRKLPMGCCELLDIGAGTTTESECDELAIIHAIPNYLWRNGSTCEKRNRLRIAGGFEAHKFRPCCYGTSGECKLLTHQHCQFLHGRWHRDYIEHCTQAQCDEEICQVSFKHLTVQASAAAGHTDVQFVDSNDLVQSVIGIQEIDQGRLEGPDEYKPNQYWRLPLSLLYHHGILQFALVAVTQLVLGTQVEKLAGWIRVGIIYIMSGLGGLMAGSALKPLEATIGGGGAVSGLIGVHLVELLQSWKLVNKPCTALFKLLGAFLLFIISGFLPQVNQFVQLVGFVYGILTAIVCLPYVTFNAWDSKARVILITIATFCLITLWVANWFTFYKVQPYNLGVLDYLNCIPFLSDQCLDKQQLLKLLALA